MCKKDFFTHGRAKAWGKKVLFRQALPIPEVLFVLNFGLMLGKVKYVH